MHAALAEAKAKPGSQPGAPAPTLTPERSGWVSVFHTYSSGESVWDTSTWGCWGTSRSLHG